MSSIEDDNQLFKADQYFRKRVIMMSFYKIWDFSIKQSKKHNIQSNLQ